MFRTTLCAIAALCIGAVQPAVAEGGARYQDWRAFFGDVEGVPTPSCVAATRAGRVSFYLAASPFHDERPEVYTVLSDPRWNISPERKKYQLEFDDTTWTMQGWGDGSELVVHWRDVGNFLAFMEDVASNELATLFSSAGNVLAVFSLEGSRSATIDLESCVKFRGVALAEQGFEVRNIESVGGRRDPF